jgi:hypothetical protein
MRAAARAASGRSCRCAIWGSATRGAPSRCRGSDRGSHCGTSFVSTLARAAGANLRRRLCFGQPLHGMFEDAPEHVRVCALKLLDQCRGIILFWAIVDLLVWVRASKRTPRWLSLSTSSAAQRSPPDLHHATGHHSRSDEIRPSTMAGDPRAPWSLTNLRKHSRQPILRCQRRCQSEVAASRLLSGLTSRLYSGDGPRRGQSGHIRFLEMRVVSTELRSWGGWLDPSVARSLLCRP